MRYIKLFKIYESREDIIDNTLLKDRSFATTMDPSVEIDPIHINKDELDSLNDILDIFTDVVDKYNLTNVKYDQFLGSAATKDKYQINFAWHNGASYQDWTNNTQAKSISINIHYTGAFLLNGQKPSGDDPVENLNSQIARKKNFYDDLRVFMKSVENAGYQILKYKIIEPPGGSSNYSYIKISI